MLGKLTEVYLNARLGNDRSEGRPRKVDDLRGEAYPLVSVIVVTYNNEEIIGGCLSSVLENNYPNYEVIVVDNASKDGTLKVVEETVRNYNAHNVKIVKNPKNYGISKGSNIGVSHSNGKYLAFLDSDSFPDPNWLFQPVELMERDPSIGAVQAKVLKARSPSDRTKLIDTAGGLMDLGLQTYARGSGEEDKGQYDEVDEIFYAVHTGAIVRRKALVEAGGFDEAFFLGYHDVDLGWRLWKRGYMVLFAPNSVVHHMRRGSTGKLKWKWWRNYHGERSYLMAIVKNADRAALFGRLLLYSLRTLLEAAGVFGPRREVAASRLLALWWVLRKLKLIWLRRTISCARHWTKSERGILMKCSIDMLKCSRGKTSWKHKLWYKPLSSAILEGLQRA
jgi:GT2 family glycosyltransferase